MLHTTLLGFKVRPFQPFELTEGEPKSQMPSEMKIKTLNQAESLTCPQHRQQDQLRWTAQRSDVDPKSSMASPFRKAYLGEPAARMTKAPHESQKDSSCRTWTHKAIGLAFFTIVVYHAKSGMLNCLNNIAPSQRLDRGCLERRYTAEADGNRG